MHPADSPHHLRGLSGPARRRKADAENMTSGLIGRWLDSGALDVPLPGRGDTMRRWRRLAELAEVDLVAARLAEAHTDAIAIMAELGGIDPKPGRLWGVWAAESRDAVLSARHDGKAISLDGTKVWCSGAGLCTHALVTARLDSGGRGTVRCGPQRFRCAGAAEYVAQPGDGRIRHPLSPIQQHSRRYP